MVLLNEKVFEYSNLMFNSSSSSGDSDNDIGFTKRHNFNKTSNEIENNNPNINEEEDTGSERETLCGRETNVRISDTKR